MSAPDRFGTDPLIGWRNWRLRVEDGMLASTTWPVVWVPGEALISKCRAPNADGSYHEGAPPQLGCSCGIWAYLDPDPARQRVVDWDMPWDPILSTVVYGRVSMWGSIIEHERGLRSSMAYPYEVFLPESKWYDAEKTAALVRGKYTIDAAVESIW